MALVIDLLSWSLLSIGGIFILIGGIGVLRLPEFYTRMHAASLTDSMGTILILVGIMLQSGASLATIKLIAILVFMLLTGPTATYALANAALLSGMKPGGSAAANGED
ncbi:MAG: monovalent cation/H(+) antiporter subunit G [Spongiibacteraceae bacterium]|jgi:multicomponent Na+:H+ antiporter subunit G